jgi:hypothetical protein
MLFQDFPPVILLPFPWNDIISSLPVKVEAKTQTPYYNQTRHNTQAWRRISSKSQKAVNYRHNAPQLINLAIITGKLTNKKTNYCCRKHYGYT